MAPDARYDIGFRPKDLIPNGVFAREEDTLNADDLAKLGRAQRCMTKDSEQLCRACGWTTYNELCGSYLPRVRIFHTRIMSGLWNLGNDYMMWDRPGDRGMRTNDYMTYKFLREQETKDIPLVEEMHQFGKEGDAHLFTVMSRVKGVPLENVWAGLSQEEKRSYADQMIAALRELRKFTAPTSQRVDGSALWDNVIGMCWPKRCHTIPTTGEEWLDGLDQDLRAGIARKYATNDEATIEARLRRLRKNFPENAPFVLTHGDLNMGNIMVHEGKILAIIDWEHAGYYPWWVERWASYMHALSENADELFDMVWAELDAEHSSDDFADNVMVPANSVAEVYKTAPIEHTQDHDVWLRPRWCECKPYGGLSGFADEDKEVEHIIDFGRQARGSRSWRGRDDVKGRAYHGYEAAPVTVSASLEKEIEALRL